MKKPDTYGGGQPPKPKPKQKSKGRIAEELLRVGPK